MIKTQDGKGIQVFAKDMDLHLKKKIGGFFDSAVDKYHILPNKIIPFSKSNGMTPGQVVKVVAVPPFAAKEGFNRKTFLDTLQNTDYNGGNVSNLRR